MVKSTPHRLFILLALAAVMAATRMHHSLLHHFDALPDASWGVFFLAGFWLRGWGRWAFPALMAEAVLIDYLVITGQGINFWDHYCVSAAYWFLVPSYLSLWLGGSWLARHQRGANAQTLGMAIGAVLASWAACYVISNGSYYWLSRTVPQPRSISAWLANLGDWYLPFLETTVLYVFLGLLLHAVVTQAVRLHVRDRSAVSR